jgi:hypothetical protein
MSYKVELKSSYIHIKFGEDCYKAEDFHELTILTSKHRNRHVILNLLTAEEFENIELLIDHQCQRLEDDLSFIIIVRESLMILFNEDLPIVPTFIESIDFFEMDEIQRKLLKE